MTISIFPKDAPSATYKVAKEIIGTQDELRAMSEHLVSKQNELCGGESRGMLIPFLIWLNKEVAPRLPFKSCYWALCILSVVIVSYLSVWSAPFIVLLAGLFTVMASYHRPLRPSGIPLADNNLDILLGRSFQVSTDDAELHANNNVTITTFKGKYILAYRQSETHMPSANTRIVVASSSDLINWTPEWTYTNGSDLRETLLFEMNDQLILYFFSLVPSHNSFKPLHVFYTTSVDAKKWTAPQEVCCRGEVPWEIKVYDGVAYKASYLGDHYGTEEVLTLFEQSTDGITWGPVGASKSSTVYRGGICEVSFEFTSTGDLVAIGRNEDGDDTGFGSQLFYAKKESLGEWVALDISMPWRFDSPRMTRTMAGEIVLFARYSPIKYQLAPRWLPFPYQKVINLVSYSIFGSKSAAVYRVVPYKEWGKEGAKAVQLIRSFENTFGDCGFFSFTREIGASAGTINVPNAQQEDCWVVANYSSTTCHSHAPWFYGQMRPTHIHVYRCRAIPLTPGDDAEKRREQ